jgi:hypothetical protein
MTTTAERDFLSIGQLAAQLQRPVRKIELAATELQIQPSLRLNHVPYFDAAAVERLTEAISTQGSKRCP